MPTIVDHGNTEREDLVTFVKKHLPHSILSGTKNGKGRFLYSGPVISDTFYLEDDDEGVDIAEIPVDRPNTILVYDRSFKDDFVDLATRYEKYNQNAVITVVIEQAKPE